MDCKKAVEKCWQICYNKLYVQRKWMQNHYSRCSARERVHLKMSLEDSKNEFKVH